jgi:hypothetical protein
MHGLHPLDYPLISYFIDWRNVGGTYILGFLGVLVTGIACFVCWRQIKDERED